MLSFKEFLIEVAPARSNEESDDFKKRWAVTGHGPGYSVNTHHLVDKEREEKIAKRKAKKAVTYSKPKVFDIVKKK